MPIFDEKRGEAIAKKKHPSESRSKPGWSKMKLKRGAQISSWILKMIAQAQEPMQY